MAQVTLREYLQGIEDTLSAGHVDDAVSKCQHVLARFPESLEVQRLLGEVYLAQGQMEEAQQSLDWILTNDPENVIAYCDRALISERLSDFDTALDCYQQAYELSRGNRDIRQQFNMLSAKAGQQGFMFSRAGLARLYMRGGLLPQAIQEWDAVLSISPDRLDARTGLLEAYWREGMFAEAEQLAQQTLHDVPGCAKALLILAHVTAPKNMQQAREYVQRAELLDPDLLMAQELFEDMMMSQSGHPFLKLLQKAPTMLDTQQLSTEPNSTQVSAEPVFARVSASNGASRSTDVPVYDVPTSAHYFDWNAAIETPSKPLEEQLSNNASALPTWSHDIFPDAWPIPSQTQQVQEPKKEEMPSLFEQKLDSTVPVYQEDQGWNSLNHLAELGTNEPLQSGRESLQTLEPTWASGIQDEPVSLAPAWLNMLTQDELRGQQQPASVSHSVIEEPNLQPAAEMPGVSTSPSQEVVPADESSDGSWRDALQASLNTTSGEEQFSFGPEWLKSLGATELETSTQEQHLSEPVGAQVQLETIQPSAKTTLPLSVVPEPHHEAHDEYEWSEPDNAVHQASESGTHTWLDALSAEPEEAYSSEQNIVNTLENLEHSLLSEGFVPLQPNSLSAIVQSQEASPDDTSYTPEPYSYREEIHEEEPYHISTLSSALEQLGNLATPHSTYQTYEPFVPAAQQTSVQPLDEPLWASSFRSVPAPRQEESDVVWQAPYDATSSPIEVSHEVAMSNFAPNALDNMQQEQQFTSPERVEAFPGPVFEPMHEAQRAETRDIPVPPVGRADAFFESELETTMKRPAVRLQAMKQNQQSVPSTPFFTTTKGRGNEAPSHFATGGGKEGPQRLQERLVQGYQHQLVGDYDEAMQEYRIIIKSAPQLLDEVVSNLRALLKLAPKYTTGYRVLGDAYMRQGEYLQAMEVYNKALTMAKKAKV